MTLKVEKKEVHILMVAFGAVGHINPMLRLGKRLLSKANLHVTLATNVANDEITNAAAAAGIHLQFYSDGLSSDFDRKAKMDYFMDTLAKFGPINLSTLIQNQSHPKFTCIINNPFVPWVADVANDHGIPCAMLWIQPSTLYAIYYRFYNDLSKFPTPTDPDLSVELPGLPLLHPQDLPSFVLPSNTFGSFPKVLSEALQNMKKLKWVFGNTFDELENGAIESMKYLYPIKSVGPLVPSLLLGKYEEQVNQSEDICIEWLNKQEPSSVIYVSFGSILEFSADDTKSIAFGLKKSKRPFIWVMKEGEEQLPVGFVEETKDRGLIVKWSPQIKVLANPSVGCFLSHCGWNSLLETIVAGVPVIAYPQWTDQPTNAKLLVDVLGVGVRLDRGRDGLLESGEVEECIEEIMSGNKSVVIRKNAAELKRAAKEAVGEGGSSDRNIQSFVDEIIADSRSKHVAVAQ